MNVGEICNRRIPTVAGTTRVLAAAKSLHAFDERFVVVTEDRAGKIFALGIVTERELVGVIAQEGNPWRLTLKDIMRPHPGFVTESDGIFDTLCWMRDNGMRGAVVHNQAGALLGMVSMDELVESLAAEIAEVVPSAAGESTVQRRNALH